RSATPLEHIFEGGVGNEASIPIGLTINRDGRKAWRQSAARHDMLRTYRLGGGVEILHVACQYLYRADACSHHARVQQVEVDKLDQRRAEWFSIVDADRFGHPRWHDHRGRKSRLKKARNSSGGRKGRAGFVEDPARTVVVGERPSE